VNDGPLSFAAALARLRALGGERRCAAAALPLRAARGMVLARDVVAPIDLPGFDNSAMDGFAVRAADLQPARETTLRLMGEAFAGIDQGLAVEAGSCVRITTGAALPAGADTVVIKENSRVEGERVHLAPGTTAGANVRRRGEDVAAGNTVMTAGSTLGSAQLGLLGALGLERVEVAARPSVAVFTSGDELRPAGTALRPGEIHDSNRLLLQALLAEEGIETLSWPALPDVPERIASALADAAEAYDVILTCGGVSAGEKDLLPGLLQRHGRVHFWKVAMRPGMPVLCGEWGRALVLGLPGNPVSVLATFRCLARPLLDAMQGRLDRVPALRARLRSAVRKSHARLEFRRGRLTCDDDGSLWVEAHAATGSHQQRGAAESNALLVLPETSTELAAGERVDVHVYGAILRA
jgi:molybdopterin molybdotransferase